MSAHITLTLTRREWSYLAEAVRLAQEAHFENDGRFDPTLSRIQRKLGVEVGGES